MSTAAPAYEEKPIPRWQKVAAVGYAILAVLLIVVFRGRMHADFWPLDDSHVAPNILATVIQIALATPFAVLLWPPARRRIHRFVTKHTAPLHAKLDEVKHLHEASIAAHAETQRRLDHIIKHTAAIPDLPEKEG